MTDVEWLTSVDPVRMLKALGPSITDRKLRLFAVACCRCASHHLIDDRSLDALDIAEELADGNVDEAERVEAAHDAEQAVYDVPDGDEQWTAERRVAAAAEWTLASDSREAAIYASDWTGDLAGLAAAQADALRDIIPKSIRKTTRTFDLTDAGIRSMAASIYESSDFAKTPLLGYLLELAGCHEADLLRHCRSPVRHFRGCWVLDLILHKT